MAVSAFSKGLTSGALTSGQVNVTSNAGAGVIINPDQTVFNSELRIITNSGLNTGSIAMGGAGTFLTDSANGDLMVVGSNGKKVRIGINGNVSAFVCDTSQNVTLGSALSMTSGTLSCGTNAATCGTLVSSGPRGTLENGYGTLANPFTSSTSAQVIWSISNGSTTNGTFRVFVWDTTLNTGTTASYIDAIFTKAGLTYSGPYNLQSSTNASITATSLALSGSNIQFTGNNTTSSMYYSLLQIS